MWTSVPALRHKKAQGRLFHLLWTLLLVHIPGDNLVHVPRGASLPSISVQARFTFQEEMKPPCDILFGSSHFWKESISQVTWKFCVQGETVPDSLRKELCEDLNYSQLCPSVSTSISLHSWEMWKKKCKVLKDTNSFPSFELLCQNASKRHV